MNETRTQAPLEEASLEGRTITAVEIFGDDGGIPTMRLHLDDGSTLYVDDPTLYSRPRKT